MNFHDICKVKQVKDIDIKLILLVMAIIRKKLSIETNCIVGMLLTCPIRQIELKSFELCEISVRTCATNANWNNPLPPRSVWPCVFS